MYDVFRIILFIMFLGGLYGYVLYDGKKIGERRYEKLLTEHLEELHGLSGIRVIKEIEQAMLSKRYWK